jgi:hypothetical protein
MKKPKSSRMRLQSLQLRRQGNLLVQSELLQRRVLRPNHFDLIADPQVVLVHQLDVLPLLHRILSLNLQLEVHSYVGYL